MTTRPNSTNITVSDMLRKKKEAEEKVQQKLEVTMQSLADEIEGVMITHPVPFLFEIAQYSSSMVDSVFDPHKIYDETQSNALSCLNEIDRIRKGLPRNAHSHRVLRSTNVMPYLNQIVEQLQERYKDHFTVELKEYRNRSDLKSYIGVRVAKPTQTQQGQIISHSIIQRS